MGRNDIQERQIDFSLGLGIARRYYDTAADLLPTDPEILEINYTIDMDQVAFAASNLLFCTELYLRNAAKDRKNAPKHHNVWRHYKRISVENRQILQRNFDERISKRTHPISMHLVLSQDEKMQKDQVKTLAADDPNQSKGEFLDLNRVLKDTGESYNTWRYNYQSIAAKQNHKIVRLHFVHLFCLCECLDEILANAYGLDPKEFELNHSPNKLVKKSAG